MDEKENVVTDESPEVESETTAPSTSESSDATETTPETETSPVDASSQPAKEDNQPRSQKRIQQLISEKKALEEKAAYWDALNAQPPAPPEEEDTVTVDGIADAVLRKQQTAQVENVRRDAQSALQRDALAALEAHPELETDDELADMVVAYAEKNKISFKASADRIKARLVQEQKKAENKVKADQANKAGASSPSGGRVSSGEMAPVNVAAMTDEEKQANWDKIISSFNK